MKSFANLPPVLLSQGNDSASSTVATTPVPSTTPATTPLPNTTSSPPSDLTWLWALIGCLGAAFLVGLVALYFCLKWRKKRRTEGRYNPNRLEVIAKRSQKNNVYVIPLPQPERLIWLQPTMSKQCSLDGRKLWRNFEEASKGPPRISLNTTFRWGINNAGKSKCHCFSTLTVTMTLKRVISNDSMGGP